jgi:hypothetical protein
MMRKIISTIVTFLIFLFLSIYAYHIYKSPLPIEVMDVDKSGLISFLEAIDSNDVGLRPASNKLGCNEYYWYKDGQTAYEICDQ